MQYKGYVGSVEFSEADGLFFGKVLGIRALISYEGANAAELVADFHDAVDDYLSLCEAENSEPEKAYSADRIEVPIRNVHPSPEPEIGDVIEIEYAGEILETYPAQIADVYGIKVIEKNKGFTHLANDD